MNVQKFVHYGIHCRIFLCFPVRERVFEICQHEGGVSVIGQHDWDTAVMLGDPGE